MKHKVLMWYQQKARYAAYNDSLPLKLQFPKRQATTALVIRIQSGQAEKIRPDFLHFLRATIMEVEYGAGIDVWILADTWHDSKLPLRNKKHEFIEIW